MESGQRMEIKAPQKNDQATPILLLLPGRVDAGDVRVDAALSKDRGCGSWLNQLHDVSGWV